MNCGSHQRLQRQTNRETAGSPRSVIDTGPLRDPSKRTYPHPGTTTLATRRSTYLLGMTTGISLSSPTTVRHVYHCFGS